MFSRRRLRCLNNNPDRGTRHANGARKATACRGVGGVLAMDDTAQRPAAPGHSFRLPPLQQQFKQPPNPLRSRAVSPCKRRKESAEGDA